MIDYIRFGFSALFIIAGLFVTITGITGIYKFKFVLNRMHCAAIIDTLGLALIMIGIIIAYGFPINDGKLDVTSIKFILVVAFLWVTSPVSSHIVSKVIYLTDSNTDKETTEVDLDTVKKGSDDNDEQ